MLTTITRASVHLGANPIPNLTGSKLKIITHLATRYDRIRDKHPLFAPISTRIIESNPDISYAKATRKLEYQTRPIEQTIAYIINWFPSHGSSS